MEVDVEMTEEEAEAEDAWLLPELWLHVLSFLPPGDLGQAALASRGLGELATLPRLWAGAKVKKIRFRTAGLQPFFAIRRYSRISQLDFSRIQLGETAIQELLEWSLTSGLRDLDLTGLNLSPVPPGLLSPALHRLCRAQLGFTKLTAEQTVHLFRHCAARPGPRPEELCLKAINLSPVPAELLAPGIARLRTANLSFTELTVEQVTALLARLAARGPADRLAALDLFSVDLSAVCPLLLARAVASLSQASLSNTELRLEQAHALCDQALHSTTLDDLNLDFAELFSVPAETLGRAMSRLERVSLACTVLGEEQVLALATALALPAARTRHLDLLDLQLTFLPPALLVSATQRLTKVNLSGSKLDPAQADALLTGLDLATIRELNLDYVMLAECEPATLAATFCAIHTVSLKKSGLTEEQLCSLMAALASSPPRLASLCLHGNSLAGAPPSTLAAAAANLHTLDLANCLLPAETAAALLVGLGAASSRLRCLTLLGNRLGEVPPAALAAAVARLQRLDLSSTGLTAVQLEAVLVSAAPPLKELSMFSLDLGSVREGVLREAETRVFVSHRHAAITPDS